MVSLFLFGSPRLVQAGRAVDLDTRKALALLAYLAVTGQPHERMVLATLFYPEYNPENARAGLRRTLSSLRSVIGEDVLDVQRNTIGLQERPALYVDLLEFRRHLAEVGSHRHPPAEFCPRCLPVLEQAVSLVKGEFMAGFSLRDSPGFDDWQFRQAEQVQRELSASLFSLANGLAASGDSPRGLQYARRLVSIDPLSESAHRLLMQLYTMSGERNTAVQQYRECVRILQQELNVSPLPETVALYQAIIEGRPQASPGEPSPTRRTPAQPKASASASGARLAPMVGRASHLQHILRAYRAGAPQGSFLLIEGEPGIGKTRLVEEFLRAHLAGDARVLRARCYEGESDLAYASLAGMLRSMIDQPSFNKALAGLPAAWVAEAARLAPELAVNRAGVLRLPPLEGMGARTRFYEGLLQVVLGLVCGEPPGVWFIDDLHWADAATIEFLAYLVRRLPGHPMLILATTRPDALASVEALHPLHAALQLAGYGAKLRLDRLTKGEVDELVSVLPEWAQLTGEMRERLYLESEGLPFFIVEYLAGLRTEGGRPPVEGWRMPGSVKALLGGRLAALDETSRQLIGAASILGRSFEFELVREISGRSEDETATGLENLLAAGLIIERADSRALSYDFSHEKIRELVYEQLSLTRRRLLHRRAVEALVTQARSHATGSGELASQIARHAQLAGQEELAAEYHWQAGLYTRRLFANSDAMQHFQHALALGYPNPGDVHQAIGDLLTLQADYASAITSYETAASFCAVGCLPEIEFKLGSVYLRNGDREMAIAHFRTAEQLLRSRQAPDALSRLYAEWSIATYTAGQPAQAIEYARSALRLAEETGSRPSLARANNVLGILARNQGDTQSAIRAFESSLHIAAELDDLAAQAAALNNLSLTFADCGDWQQAIELAQRALSLCVRQGDRHRQAALNNNLADLFHKAGDEASAMLHLQEAVAIFAEIGVQAGRPRPEIWMLTEW